MGVGAVRRQGAGVSANDVQVGRAVPSTWPPPAVVPPVATDHRRMFTEAEIRRIVAEELRRLLDQRFA